MTSSQKSVAVIGGGLSGLSSAYTLLNSDKDINVTVFEAKDRVGGRSYSKKYNGAWFDHGGMWVGPHQKHVLEMAEKANIKQFKQEYQGTKVLEFGNKRGFYKSDIPNNVNIFALLQMQYYIWQIDREAKKVPSKNPSLCKKACYWDSMTLGQYINRIPFTKVQKLMEVTCRIVFGCEMNEISMLHFLWYVNQSGGFDNLVNTKDANQDSKLELGSWNISQFLQDFIQNHNNGTVKLNSPILSINQSEKVEITVQQGQKLQFDYVVMAMPPVSVSKIQFEPKLSPEREFIVQHNFAGSIQKTMVLYEKRFWKEKSFSGEALSDSTDHPIVGIFEDSRPKENGEQQPALVVFTAGSVYRTWSNLTQQQFENRIIEKIGQYYKQPEEAKKFLKIISQDWQKEPFIYGGPVSTFPTGVLSQLKYPIYKNEGLVHWAGTEHADESQGFLDGAVQSGKRAANEILQRYDNTFDAEYKGLKSERQHNQYVEQTKRIPLLTIILFLISLVLLVKFFV